MYAIEGGPPDANAQVNLPAAQRAIRIHAIHTRILSYLPRAALGRASLVHTDWFATAAPYLYSNLEFHAQHNTSYPKYAWPFVSAGSFAPGSPRGVEWAKGTALDAVRVVSISTHSHAACDDFVFPTSIKTPGRERPIVALRVEWRDWSTFIHTCSIAECFNPSTVVLHSLSTLTTRYESSIPCLGQKDSRVRKLVFVLDPPTAPPEYEAIYQNLPTCIEHIVIHLRPPIGTARTSVRSWGAELAAHMRKHGWGPDKLAGHFANLLVYIRHRKMRCTFVGCEQLDEAWVSSVRPTPYDGMLGVDEEDNASLAFERLIKSAVQSRLDKLRKVDEAELGTVEVKDMQIHFATRQEYLDQGDCEGEIVND